jgi:hypothetical protein
MKHILIALVIFINSNSYSQTTLYFDNMECLGYTWRGIPKTLVNSGYIGHQSSPTDNPASCNLFVSSDSSFRVTGNGLGSSAVERDTLVYSMVNINPAFQHELRFRVASVGLSPALNPAAGADGTDYVELNYTLNGVNYIREIKLSGISNVCWDYTNTASIMKTANGSLNTFVGPASKVSLMIPAGISQIGFQIIMAANATGETWLIDDVELIEGCYCPLPITLLEFKGYQVGNKIKLEWTTLTETHNDYFSILESPHNLEYWYLVNTVDGAGNSNQPLTYTTLDTNPKEGVNYYVLTQTDFDGTRVQYGPIAVQYNHIPQYNIWEHYNLLGQEIK